MCSGAEPDSFFEKFLGYSPSCLYKAIDYILLYACLTKKMEIFFKDFSTPPGNKSKRKDLVECSLHTDLCLRG